MPNDLIIVLGSQPDLTTWKFPEQASLCLRRAKELLDTHQAPFIVTSGKWVITVDTLGLHQPFRECDAMADFLISEGVDPAKILKEGRSQDTISNFYYLKTGLLIPRKVKNLVFVAAEFKIPRLQFLCKQILGTEYMVNFEPIEGEPSPGHNESLTFKLQKDFLEPMKPGDHEWLADKFYTAPMYLQMAKLDKEKFSYLDTKNSSN